MHETKGRLLRPAALVLLGLLLLAPAACRHDDDSYREPDPPSRPDYRHDGYRHDGYPYRNGRRVYRGKIEVPDGQAQDDKRIYRGKIEAPDGRRVPPPRIDPKTGSPLPPPRIDPKTGRPLPPPRIDPKTGKPLPSSRYEYRLR